MGRKGFWDQRGCMKGREAGKDGWSGKELQESRASWWVDR